MHNFLESQPDLNMHNPAVQDAILAQFKFWLDRGVDGFRLDVANCYMHDPLLRDNPPVDDPKPQFFNVDFPTPFTMQDHIYDFSRPENIVFVKRIRAPGLAATIPSAGATQGPRRLSSDRVFGPEPSGYGHSRAHE